MFIILFLWVLWASTKRIYQLSFNACTFRINEENKSYTYIVVFLHVQWKIGFGWIDHERLVKMSGRFLTFDDKAWVTFQRLVICPWPKKKLFLIILNNIVYYTFLFTANSFDIQQHWNLVKCCGVLWRIRISWKV